MAEYSAIALQTINPGESAVFTNAPVPCLRNFVRWRDGTGAFNLSGWVPNRPGCCPARSAQYLVNFGANIAVPEGETVGPISVALALDGVTLTETTMMVPPAAVEEFFNVSRATTVPIWRNCCQTLTVRNTSNIPILMQQANIIFSRPDLAVTY
jgi:hypothetical protein